MTNPPRAALACMLSLAIATELHAQDQNTAPVSLPEVVVTDTTSSLVSPSAETAKEQLSQIPGAANVVTSKEFQEGRGAYLDDFLNYQPGLFVQSSQGSEDTKISDRGSGIQADAVSGLEVLLDGMAINQGDGEAFLQDFDLRDVKYAEVYRGADAMRYGGFQLGGAVNLVTMTGHDAPLLEAWSNFGSYDLFEQGLLSGWSSGPWDVFASFSNHSLDGFREHSQESDQKVFLSIGTRLGDNAENRFYVFWGNVDQNNPASLTKEEMYQNPTQTTPESIAQNWDTNWAYVRLADQLVVKGDDWQFQLGGYWNHRNQLQRQEFDDDTPVGIVRFTSDDFGGQASFDYTGDLFGQQNRVTVGILPTFEGERDTSYENLNGNAGSIISADDTFASNIVLYGEEQHYFTRAFSVLAGMQLVYIGRNYFDRLNLSADGNQTNDEVYRSLNPKIGALYEFNSDTQGYVNFSRSFQPPSFDDSVTTADDGDQLFDRLSAQRAYTIEAGTRGKYGPVSWDLAFYHSWVQDELLDLTDGHGIVLGTVNAPRTSHQGIEAEVEAELAHGIFARGASSDAEDRLTLEQTYTYSDFHFVDNPSYGNNRIAGMPVDYYKAELLYEHPCGFYCGPSVEWNVIKYPVDEANTLYADPYALLGFKIGYKSSKGYDVFFEATNLTNKIYAATVEPVGDARVEGDDDFNPGNGRGFYGGVSARW
ncbi:MAG: TonB-dependent receptor [Chthoniobacteraceae bacterium]|jgi:iron complex outermembrane receptor protein